MRALSSAELLDVWEKGSRNTSAAWALELLAAVSPEETREHLESLSVGQRDETLLALREGLLGPDLSGTVVCPECGQGLDVIVNLGAIRSAARLPDREVRIDVSDFDLCFRPVSTRDAVAVCGLPDVEAGTRLIIERCLLSARRDGVPIDAEEIPPEVAGIALQGMIEADSMADIQIAVTCAACESRWSATLDIVSLLWTEIEAWACRTLSDVHALATAYGWSEREILSLSPYRRQRYLELVGA